MSLCFDDLTDASRPHCILGREGELVPGATLEVLQAVGALAGTDGEVPPLLAVVLRVLQDVAWSRHTETLLTSAIFNIFIDFIFMFLMHQNTK